MRALVPLLSVDLASAARVWQRNVWVYRNHWLYALLPNFFEPLLYLLGMGVGLGFYVSTGGEFGGSYLAFIAPGLVSASAMNGAIFETTYNVFVKLHFGKYYDAVVTTRVNLEDAAVGEMLWATTRAVLYSTAFLIITLFFETPITGRLLLTLPALALVGFCFAAIGLAYTSLIGQIDLFNYFFTLFITPSFLFSGIFFPLEDRFPGWLAALAEFTPLYRGVDLVRHIVNGGGGEPWLDVAYLLVVGVVLANFAVWRLKKRVIR